MTINSKILDDLHIQCENCGFGHKFTDLQVKSTNLLNSEQKSWIRKYHDLSTFNGHIICPACGRILISVLNKKDKG
jgi:RNase P subunit RPR2